MMGIQEALSANHATLVERSSQMKERWQEIQRDEYMRMRKSVLNQKFFPRHRREVLHNRFSSWVRFFLWKATERPSSCATSCSSARWISTAVQRPAQAPEGGAETKREGGARDGQGEVPRSHLHVSSQGACGAVQGLQHLHLTRTTPWPAVTIPLHSRCTASRLPQTGHDCQVCLSPHPSVDLLRQRQSRRCWLLSRAPHPKPTDAVYDKLVNAIIERDRQESVELMRS